MSMSMTAYGVVPGDDKFREMKAIWDSCKAAKVPAPDHVREFFGWVTPSEAGALVRLAVAAEFYGDEEEDQGIEVDLAKLPPGVTRIRFVCRW